MVPRPVRNLRRIGPILRPDSASVDSPAVPKATKRERQRQNKEARRAACRRRRSASKRNRTIRNLVLLLIPLVIIFVCSSSPRATTATSKQFDAPSNFDHLRHHGSHQAREDHAAEARRWRSTRPSSTPRCMHTT